MYAIRSYYASEALSKRVHTAGMANPRFFFTMFQQLLNGGIEMEAVKALSALAQETRLALFRLLIRRGSLGLSAGEVADALGVAPSALSFHSYNFV